MTTISFPETLTRLLEQEKPIISWNKKNQIVIQNVVLFKSKILVKYFKNTNITCFYKQLNLYGFRKQNHEENSVIFKHKLLKNVNDEKSVKHILQNIQPKQKSSTVKHKDDKEDTDTDTDTDSNTNTNTNTKQEGNNNEPFYDPVSPTIFDLYGNIPDLYPNTDVKEWIVYITDISRFIKNTQYSTWGINNVYENTSDFLLSVKPGDRLWFIGVNNPSVLIGVAIYSSHKYFTEWPLIEIDMSHDTEINGCCCQGCWQHHGKHNEKWNIKITYTHLFILTSYDKIKFLQSNQPHYNKKHPQIIRYNNETGVFNLEVCYSYIKFKTL
jgi:hypothetical protein